jgi:hypothetical protein
MPAAGQLMTSLSARPIRKRCLTAVAGLLPVSGKPGPRPFDGEQLSCESGPLVLREVENRLGVARRVAACIHDPRVPERVVHALDKIVRFRMLMTAAGYEDGNDADGAAAR